MKPYLVMTDASNLGIGAVLLQLDDEQDGFLPLEFASKRFSPTEAKWDVRERELYALKWAVQRWESYLRLNPFMVATDHQNLTYLHSATLGKVARWALYLQQFPYSVVYVKGDNNVVADWLSRCLPDVNDDEELDVMAMNRQATECFVAQRPSFQAIRLPTLEEFIEAYTTSTHEEVRMCVRTRFSVTTSIRRFTSLLSIVIPS